MKTILLLAAVFASQLMYAQKNQFGLSVGRSIFQIQDLGVSPHVYRSPITTARLNWQNTSTRNQWNVGAEAGLGPLFVPGLRGRTVHFDTEYPDGDRDSATVLVQGQTLNARLSVGYLRRLNEASSRNSFTLGALIYDDLMNTDGFTRPGLSNMATLAPQVGWESDAARKHSIALQLVFPIGGFVSRLPYSGAVSEPGQTSRLKAFFNTGTHWRWVGPFVQPRLSVVYQYRLNSHWAITGGYRFAYTHINSPRPLTMVQNGIELGIRKM